MEPYIVGGCFNKQMNENGYFKSMGQGQTRYRAVKIMDGYDALQFQSEILKRIERDTKIL